MRVFVVAAMAIAMSVSATGPALAQSAPSASERAAVAAFEAWVGDNTAWSNQFVELGSQATDVLLAALDDGDAAVEKIGRGDRRTYASWAANQRQMRFGAFDQIDQRFMSLPGSPPPPPAVVADLPAVRSQIEHSNNVRDRVGTMLRQTRAGITSFYAKIDAAASGRDRDVTALQIGALDLMTAQLDVENLMMESTKGPPGQFSYYFNDAQIAGNEALKVWLGVLRADGLGEPWDHVVAAQAIIVHVGTIREAATDMQTAGQRTVRQVLNEPSFRGSRMAQAMPTLGLSLDESAAVENQIADVLERVAQQVGAGQLELAQAELAAFEQLVQRRTDIANQRAVLVESLGN